MASPTKTENNRLHAITMKDIRDIDSLRRYIYTHEIALGFAPSAVELHPEVFDRIMSEDFLPVFGEGAWPYIEKEKPIRFMGVRLVKGEMIYVR